MGDRSGWRFARDVLKDLRPLFTPPMLAFAWAPCMAIALLHYRTGPELAWVHDILRRLFYLPILLAAFSAGLRGGVAISIFASLTYFPHAFTMLLGHDPADALEKGLEIVLYNIVAVAAGLLVDRERRERAKQERLARQLGDALDEQRRTEAQLIRAGRLGALGELTAGIAHEIKNPLHGLKGTAEILKDAIPEGAPERKMLDLHISEIGRLEDTAERFLSFARPIQADRRLVDPGELVERVASLIVTQARKEGVDTAIEIAEDVVPFVMGDPELLAQLLLNLGLNGLQAMAPAGRGRLVFRIDSRSDGGKGVVRFRVANDGPAIPEDRLERIFDPFYTTKDDGTGLGLSICSRIADQHDGILEVRNLPAGAGVEFDLTLAAVDGGGSERERQDRN